ncbi:MAG: hypothetical protein UHX92_04315 [Acutalibacteraceae bacterium]|nr:hypothetical protein [Acutalibacteraceae bacterium]
MKIKILFAVLLAVVVLFPISAAANASVDMKDIDETFYVFSNASDREKVSKITGEETEDLKEYCSSNGIIYLAVNEDNSKQIRISRTKSNFSEKLGNISFLTDGEIEDVFAEDIKASSKYKLTEKNSQKFIVFENRYSDSGGKYTLTSFVTVANENLYTLSFYTSENSDTEYMEKVFDGYECDSFLNHNSNSNNGYTLIIVTVLLALLALWIIYTLVRDLISKD